MTWLGYQEEVVVLTGSCGGRVESDASGTEDGRVGGTSPACQRRHPGIRAPSCEHIKYEEKNWNQKFYVLCQKTELLFKY